MPADASLIPNGRKSKLGTTITEVEVEQENRAPGKEIGERAGVKSVCECEAALHARAQYASHALWQRLARSRLPEKRLKKRINKAAVRMACFLVCRATFTALDLPPRAPKSPLI